MINSLLLSVCLPMLAQGPERPAPSNVKAVVAYMDSRGPLVTLPLGFTFPTSIESIKEAFPEKAYIVRESEDGVALVVERRIDWVRPDLGAIELLRDLLKRPDPLAAVKIGELTEQGQAAAISLIDFIQPKMMRAVEDQDLGQCAIALSVDVFFVHAATGYRFAPMVSLESSNGSAKSVLLAHPVRGREPTEHELAARMASPRDVVVRHYGSPPDLGEKMVSAAKSLALLKQDLAQQKESVFNDLLTKIEPALEKSLGGLRIGGTARLGTASQGIAKEFSDSFLSNWQINRYKSREQAQEHLMRDEPYKLVPSIGLTWARGEPGRGTPSFIQLEIYRGS